MRGCVCAGPLYIKDTMECMGVCEALFLCCATRAVHLELVKDLSATAFTDCLRRFKGGNEMPVSIVSDNANTFQAMERTLSQGHTPNSNINFE